MKVFKIIAGVLVFLIAFYITISVRSIDIPEPASQKIIVKEINLKENYCNVVFSSPDGEFTVKDTDVASCENLEIGQDATSAFS